MQQMVWLALGYNVPVNPSKNRVYVWRKLKEYGAGYFKQGVAILPLCAQSMVQFRSLASKIRDMGGDATLAELKFCDTRDEARMIAWFEAQSETEYRELIRDCADMLGKIIFAVDNEDNMGNDEYIKKMSKRYKKVRSRDYFKSSSQKAVTQGMEELFVDMAHATDSLKKQIRKMFLEK